MIGAGVIGAVILGFIQDKKIDTISQFDQINGTALHTTYVTQQKQSLFGPYQTLDQKKLSSAPEQDKTRIDLVQETAKKDALKLITVIPLAMMVCYLILSWYFRRKGGYSTVVLTPSSTGGKSNE